ncbi:CHAP domain-containing protein [Streptococcus equi]|uniref:CHAP domain-containing protein n=1 Tax=Streptococcus equi subsp. ruminatorum TaxID=254358 RepID=A0A6M1KRN2_9STRE|nr:CHAP domain-containing protein [Streptococcus equi]NGL83816.1 CHAP domain-containing protein [Streptococcus equi subsp. ruminatorum]
MRKNKLLRMIMLMTLLAPHLETARVLAEDTGAESSQVSGTAKEAAIAQTGDSTSAAAATSATDNSSSTTETTTNSGESGATGSSNSTASSGSASGSTGQPAPTSPAASPQPAPEVATQASQPALNIVPAAPTVDLSLTLALPSVNTYAAYVAHWSGQSAYTHNLLSRRYGIKAEQLDSFLKSTKIKYDEKRINGAALLQWEKKSGLDVRAIVAIAMTESELGTKGNATLLGSNMFGYALFDLDSKKPNQFNDELAIVKLTQETIIKNSNLSLEQQDQKADKFAKKQLNFASDGGLYFTDTNGIGKRRAKIMEELDAWIDHHGGTPEIPAELKIQSSSSFAVVPTGYKLSKSYDILSYQASSYAWGQCTWYVYNRAKELGYQFDSFMGNGGDWRFKSGYSISKEPKVGYAVSFAPGQAGADGLYGHVSIVEDVRKDGSILISESNCLGLGQISYRTFTAEQANQLTYVVGKS